MKLSLDDYFSTVADYNRAEFDLFHAVGYPAAELAYRQPPGDVVPVDTNRPAYLPRRKRPAPGNRLTPRRVRAVTAVERHDSQFR